MLTQLENNIKVQENRLISFCHEQNSYMPFRFDVFSTLIIQSSTYVKAGDQIEITAGIGAFSTSAQPKIIIKGRNLLIGEDGATHYKFSASTIPGKHSIPVKISFTDKDGVKKEMEKRRIYTVADEKQ
jgi:hypothetical protein